MFNELDEVKIIQDLPTAGIKSGDIGTIVHKYQNSSNYEVEFTDQTGHTTGVVTLDESQIAPVVIRKLIKSYQIQGVNAVLSFYSSDHNSRISIRGDAGTTGTINQFAQPWN